MSRDSLPPSDSRPFDELARLGRRVLTLSAGERELSRAVWGDAHAPPEWPRPRLIGSDGRVITIAGAGGAGRPA